MGGAVGVLVYGIAVGFGFSGLLASTVNLVTGAPLSFALSDRQSPCQALLGLLLRVATGPVLLMRNAIESARAREVAIIWLIAAAVVACAWSFLIGVVVVETLASLLVNSPAMGG